MKLAMIIEDKYTELPDDDVFMENDIAEATLYLRNEHGTLLGTILLYASADREWSLEWLSKHTQYYDIYEAMRYCGAFAVINSILTMFSTRNGGQQVIKSVVNAVGMDTIPDLHQLTKAVLKSEAANRIVSYIEDAIVDVMRQNPGRLNESFQIIEDKYTGLPDKDAFGPVTKSFTLVLGPGRKLTTVVRTDSMWYLFQPFENVTPATYRNLFDIVHECGDSILGEIACAAYKLNSDNELTRCLVNRMMRVLQRNNQMAPQQYINYIVCPPEQLDQAIQFILAEYKSADNFLKLAISEAIKGGLTATLTCAAAGTLFDLVEALGEVAR